MQNLRACVPACLPACLPAGLPACRPAGLPAWWAGGLVGCRPAGLPAWWAAGLGGCRPACSLLRSRGEGGPSARRVGHGTPHEQFFYFLNKQTKSPCKPEIGQIVLLANRKQSCYNRACSNHFHLHPASLRRPSSV